MDAEKIRQVMLFECFAGPVAWQQTGRIEPAVDLGVDPLTAGQGDQDPFARVFIAFKLVHHLAGANAYGQILTGLSRPAAEISRGASAHDVFGAAAIVGCQAIDQRLLYGVI